MFNDQIDSKTKELKERLRDVMPDLAAYLYPTGRRIGAHWCTGDADGAPGTSFKIRLTGEKRGLHGDFAGAEGHSQSPLDLWMTARRVDFPTARREAADWLGLGWGGLPPRPPRASAAAAASSGEPKPLLLPPMHRGAPAELEELAALRQINVEACRMASSVGWLHFGEWKGERAWFLRDTEGRNGQVRRLDGQPWAEIRAKAWTLPGAMASWPIGIEEALHYPAVLLVEGAPDLLAALHFIFETRNMLSWCPVALLGASLSLPEEALAMLAGKVVRIYRHADAPGEAAAWRWAEQLRDYDCEVDVFSFDGMEQADGTPVQDLNDAVRICAAHRNQLEELLP